MIECSQRALDGISADTEAKSTTPVQKANTFGIGGNAETTVDYRIFRLAMQLVAFVQSGK